MKRKKIDLYPYKRFLYVCKHDTIEDFEKIVFDTYWEEIKWIEAFYKSIEWEIHLRPNYKISVLSHEILHMVLRTLESVWIVYSWDSEEAFTYLMEYSMESALEEKGYK